MKTQTQADQPAFTSVATRALAARNRNYIAAKLAAQQFSQYLAEVWQLAHLKEVRAYANMYEEVLAACDARPQPMFATDCEEHATRISEAMQRRYNFSETVGIKAYDAVYAAMLHYIAH